MGFCIISFYLKYCICSPDMKTQEYVVDVSAKGKPSIKWEDTKERETGSQKTGLCRKGVYRQK